MTLTEARGRAIQGVCLQLSAEGFDDQWTDQLAALLKSHQGDPAALCPIFIEYEAKTVGARLRLGDAWRVVPNDDLIADLRQRFGRDHVRLDYDWSSAAS
jgi:DNA polymerase-3 subunit alpha